MQPRAYHVYILRCSDGSLYTGITTDVDRRVREHNGEGTAGVAKEGIGSKYVRARRPATLVWSTSFPDRSSASREEARIKRMAREEKLALVASESVVP